MLQIVERWLANEFGAYGEFMGNDSGARRTFVAFCRRSSGVSVSTCHPTAEWRVALLFTNQPRPGRHSAAGDYSRAERAVGPRAIRLARYPDAFQRRRMASRNHVERGRFLSGEGVCRGQARTAVLARWPRCRSEHSPGQLS